MVTEVTKVQECLNQVQQEHATKFNDEGRYQKFTILLQRQYFIWKNALRIEIYLFLYLFLSAHYC